jgi:hypothetical protein
MSKEYVSRGRDLRMIPTGWHDLVPSARGGFVLRRWSLRVVRISQSGISKLVMMENDHGRPTL